MQARLLVTVVYITYQNAKRFLVRSRRYKQRIVYYVQLENQPNVKYYGVN